MSNDARLWFKRSGQEVRARVKSMEEFQAKKCKRATIFRKEVIDERERSRKNP